MVEDSVCVVTGTDETYVGLCCEMLESLTAGGGFQPDAIVVLDFGIAGRGRAELARYGVRIVEPGWDHGATRNLPSWFKSRTARPHLPKHAPGFGTYLWLDADTWVQVPERLADLVQAARHGAVAIAAEQFVGRLTLQSGPSGSATIDEASVRRNVSLCYSEGYGAETAARWLSAPIYNTGVFALAGSSPVWQTWAGYLERGLARTAHPLIEQQALCLAILEGDASAAPMPSLYNWNVTLARPMLGADRSLVSPVAPHEPLVVFHLTDLKSLKTCPMQDGAGGKTAVPLSYRNFRAWQSAP